MKYIQQKCPYKQVDIGSKECCNCEYYSVEFINHGFMAICNFKES